MSITDGHSARSFEALRVGHDFPIPYDRSVHETKILEYFGECLRSKEKRQPVETVFICFTNRCGSNFLAEALFRTGKLRRAGEYFNWPSVLKRSRDEGFASLEDFCLDLAASKHRNGMFASKIGAAQLFFLARVGIVPSVLGPPRFLHIRRRDLLMQAISHSIAKQTGSWTSGHAPRNTPVYHAPQIAKIVRQTALNNAMFQEFFAYFGFPVFEVTYEELIKDPSGHVSAITEWLGLGASVLESGSERLSRQEDPTKDEWRCRFLAESRRHLEGEAADFQTYLRS